MPQIDETDIEWVPPRELPFGKWDRPVVEATRNAETKTWSILLECGHTDTRKRWHGGRRHTCTQCRAIHTEKIRKQQEDKADLFAHYWKLLAPKDAPQPRREVEFWGNKKCGGRAKPWKFDFCWHDWTIRNNPMLIVEIDGGQYSPHGGRHNTDSDRHKCNDAAVSGYRVLHYTPQMLERDPQACVNQVLRALGYDAPEM